MSDPRTYGKACRRAIRVLIARHRDEFLQLIDMELGRRAATPHEPEKEPAA